MVEDLIGYNAKDSLTGYNICEFIAHYGSVQLLECLTNMIDDGNDLGRALEIAI